MKIRPARRSSAQTVAGALAVLVAGALLAGCGSGSGSSPSSASSAGPTVTAEPTTAASAALVTASKNERGLIIYGNPPAQLWGPVVKVFNAQYPWIKVTPYDVDDNTVFSKYAAEHGEHARTADIVVASAPNLWVNATKTNTVIDYTPADISHFPAFAKQFAGVFVLSADPAITIYNTALVSKSQVPDTFAALTASVAAGKYHGKLSTYAINNTFGYAAFYGLVAKTGWSVLDTLGPQTRPAADGGAMLNAT